MIVTVLKANPVQNNHHQMEHGRLMTTTPLAIAELMHDIYEATQGEVVHVVTDSRGDIYYLEVCDEQVCWNWTKAWARAHGLEVSLPEYEGPYSLSAMKALNLDPNDHGILIIPTNQDYVLKTEDEAQQ